MNEHEDSEPPDKIVGNALVRRSQKVQGLGDVVEKVLDVTGIGPAYKKVRGGGCGGCAKRRDWLNKKVPLRGKTGE